MRRNRRKVWVPTSVVLGMILAWTAGLALADDSVGVSFRHCASFPGWQPPKTLAEQRSFLRHSPIPRRTSGYRDDVLTKALAEPYFVFAGGSSLFFDLYYLEGLWTIDPAALGRNLRTVGQCRGVRSANVVEIWFKKNRVLDVHVSGDQLIVSATPTSQGIDVIDIPGMKNKRILVTGARPAFSGTRAPAPTKPGGIHFPKLPTIKLPAIRLPHLPKLPKLNLSVLGSFLHGSSKVDALDSALCGLEADRFFVVLAELARTNSKTQQKVADRLDTVIAALPADQRDLIDVELQGLTPHDHWWELSPNEKIQQALVGPARGAIYQVIQQQAPQC